MPTMNRFDVNELVVGICSGHLYVINQIATYNDWNGVRFVYDCYNTFTRQHTRMNESDLKPYQAQGRKQMKAFRTQNNELANHFAKEYVKFLEDMNKEINKAGGSSYTLEELEKVQANQRLPGLEDALPQIEEKLNPEKIEGNMLREKIIALVENNPGKAAQIIHEMIHTSENNSKIA